MRLAIDALAQALADTCPHAAERGHRCDPASHHGHAMRIQRALDVYEDPGEVADGQGR